MLFTNSQYLELEINEIGPEKEPWEEKNIFASKGISKKPFGKHEGQF